MQGTDTRDKKELQQELQSSTRDPQMLKTYSGILPLSLGCHLVGYLGHPGPRAKLKKLDPPKGLGEQVNKLILGVDVARFDASFCQTVTDEVVPHPDVFAPFMEQGGSWTTLERTSCPP
jgi:hypothetical protein